MGGQRFWSSARILGFYERATFSSATCLYRKEGARFAGDKHLDLTAGSGCGNEQEAPLAMFCLSPRGTVGRLGESRRQRQCSAIRVGYDDAAEGQSLDAMHRGQTQTRFRPILRLVAAYPIGRHSIRVQRLRIAVQRGL